MGEANKDGIGAASRSMPPPPIPAQSSVTPADHAIKYANIDRQYGGVSQAQQAADFDKKVVVFDSKLTEILAEMKKKEQEQAQKSHTNDKPVPHSIANLHHLSDTHRSRPNVYASPYASAPEGCIVATAEQGGSTKYGKGPLSRVVEETDDLDGEEWVDVGKAGTKESTSVDGTLDTEWVRIEIERKKARSAAVEAGVGGPGGPAYHPHHHHRLITTSHPGVGVTGGLAESFYAGRSTDEKKKIEAEMERLGWYVGDDEE